MQLSRNCGGTAPDVLIAHLCPPKSLCYEPLCGLRGGITGSVCMAERQHSFDYDDLLACGRGELFGPGNAQLPLPPMLMFDRISEISEEGGEYGKGLMRAELEVKPD